MSLNFSATLSIIKQVTNTQVKSFDDVITQNVIKLNALTQVQAQEICSRLKDFHNVELSNLFDTLQCVHFLKRNNSEGKVVRRIQKILIATATDDELKQLVFFQRENKNVSRTQFAKTAKFQKSLKEIKKQRDKFRKTFKKEE